MTAGGMWLTASLCMSKVVVLLVRASTSSADGVDMRGKCLTSIDESQEAGDDVDGSDENGG